MSDPWKDWAHRQIDARKKAGLLRQLEALTPRSAVDVVREDGQELLLFSSNDYLGLSQDPRVIDGVINIIEKFGLGPRGSPLICGYTHLHQRAEQQIATWKGTDAALLCPTGFAANLATLSALADEQTTIYSDALNHASIIDGCTLARRQGAKLAIYPHGDTERLHQMLANCPTERALVVTDSVFSMDGDLAPLKRLSEICNTHHALLVIDEAHGSFVFGDQGRGLAAHCGVSDAVDVHIGTLSKGCASLGGFIATSDALRTVLLNQGRSYIYSTAAPLSVIGAILASLDIVTSDPSLQQALWERIDQLGQSLGRPLASPIVPLIVGDEEAALRASDALRQRGIDVTAIRPPTVPAGTSRLRLTLSAAHSADDIDRLASALDHLADQKLIQVTDVPTL